MKSTFFDNPPLTTCLPHATENTVLSGCRIAPGKTKIISRFAGLTWQQLVQMITGKDVDICPVCKTGRMTRTMTIKPVFLLA